VFDEGFALSEAQTTAKAISATLSKAPKYEPPAEMASHLRSHICSIHQKRM
jgi:hypothetical protein